RRVERDVDQPARGWWPRCGGRPWRAPPGRPAGRGSLTAEELLHLRRELAGIEIRQIRLTGLLGTPAERGTARAGTGRGLLRGLGLLACGLGRVLGLGLLDLLLRSLPAARLLAHAHAGPAGHARHRAAAHAPAHRPHHLLGLLEALEQLVDLLDGGPGAAGDAVAARAVDDLGVVALLGRHRADDRLDPADLALVEIVQRLAVLPHVRQHAEHLLDAAHVLELLHLAQEVVEGEVLAR